MVDFNSFYKDINDIRAEINKFGVFGKFSANKRENLSKYIIKIIEFISNQI